MRKEYAAAVAAVKAAKYQIAHIEGCRDEANPSPLGTAAGVRNDPPEGIRSAGWDKVIRMGRRVLKWKKEQVDSDDDDDEEEAYEGSTGALWHIVVNEYTAKALTYDSDRLPAISGLAKQLARRLGKYHVGHWENDPFGLLWYPAEPTGRRPQTKHVPPSWSWASVEGTNIVNEGMMGGILFQVKKWSITPAGGDPFSTIKVGRIQVRAYAEDAIVENREDDGDGYTLKIPGGQVFLTPDIAYPGSEDQIYVGQKLCCMRCGWSYMAPLIGLALLKTERRGTFRRVGRLRGLEPEGPDSICVDLFRSLAGWKNFWII